MKPLHFAAMIIALFSVFMLTSRIRANNLEPFDATEKNEIHKAIELYFNARYRSFGSLQLEDLVPMTDNSPQGYSFLNSESDKLIIEIQHAKMNKLGYAEYKYFLDFKEILVDKSSQIATVSLLEGHDVVFEISKEISQSQPVVSTMRNLKHTITLRKVQGQRKPH